MTDFQNVVDHALQELGDTAPPPRRRSEIRAALEARKEMLLQAARRGWTPGQIARRLHEAGVRGSVDVMRVHIRSVIGVPKRSRTQKP